MSEASEIDELTADDFAKIMTGNKLPAKVEAEARSGFDTAEYHREKILGLRRANGAKPLKKLNARHHRIIALHLTGQYSNNDIAEMLGFTAAWVSTVLGDPLAQKIINNYLSGTESERAAMQPLYNAALRKGLQDKDVNVQLRAADIWHRHEKGNPEAGKVNVNVAFVNSTRERFLTELRDAAELKEIAQSS